jgi:hypothetical protein
MRSASASAHFDHCSIGANIRRSPQRFCFVEQPIDPCLFELSKTLSLFVFKLELTLTRLLFQLRFPPHPPFEFTDAAFAVADLSHRDDLNCNVPDKTLEAAPAPILPGRPDLIPIVAGEDGKAQLSGSVATMGSGLGFSRGRRSSETATLA